MNSEELEQSLRTEFESYLKDILAEMKQEVADFQTKFQDEFEKHRTQLDTVFQDFSSRIENDRQLDAPFKDSIVEHLRLARDEGASITATAIAEAEAMQKEADAQTPAPPPVADYSGLRNAVQDISEKDSQSAILKALVSHAGQFTPRGAFFIIKNEHFVGWRVFGEEGETDEQTVREIFFPINSDTILGESVRSLSAVESSGGTYAEDSLFLNKLEFGNPEKMIAIPLVARNRGVAVLYADYGTKNEQINVEALEMLVRVAGLTVELLAASQTAKPRKEESPANSANQEAVNSGEERESQIAAPHQAAGGGFEKPAANEHFDASPIHDAPPEIASPKIAPPVADLSGDYQYQPVAHESNFEYTNEFQPSAGEDHSLKTAEKFGEISGDAPQAEEMPSEFSWNQPFNASDKYARIVETPPAETESETAEVRDFSFEPSTENAAQNAAVSDYEFDSYQPHDFSTEIPAAKVETAEHHAAEFQIPQSESTYQNWNSGAAEEPKFETSGFEPAAQTFHENTARPFEEINPVHQEMPTTEIEKPAEAAAPPKSRLSERNVDLPIEVPEDERRSHNDARRFARLLVSEIKLYNEQKVKEGREMNDLYDRLREAIDRSREMYDKRVQSPVAAKFDYFHYELVNNLAEGSESKLGAAYKGATA